MFFYMKEEKSSFMKNLKKIRKLKGLSQQDIAEKTGLTIRKISYYENYAVNPPIDKIKLIAEILNVKISDLLKDECISNKMDEYENVDPRILKKIIKIQSLPLKEQKKIWDYINTIIKNQEFEKQMQGAK